MRKNNLNLNQSLFQSLFLLENPQGNPCGLRGIIGLNPCDVLPKTIK
jgi:hypothetical protein